jgi:hypothetical protein
MQPGWEFNVNANGRTWYAQTNSRKTQLWRPELHNEEENADEEEDPETVALREAAAATAELLELIAALKTRQADLAASVVVMQGKADAQAKALKTKKGDALKAGQAQQQILEKQIKETNQDLASLKLQISDAQKKLPSSAKSVAVATQPRSDSNTVGKKEVSSGSSKKPPARANTMAPSKIAASTTSTSKHAVAPRPVPISRSSTIAAVSSAGVSASPAAPQKTVLKTVTPTVEIKEFGRTAERLDGKLLAISDEVCLDVDDQIWAPIKQLSFFPVLEKPQNNLTVPVATEVKNSVASSSMSTPSKTAASTPVKSSATPLSRSGSIASSGTVASPLSSARK